MIDAPLSVYRCNIFEHEGCKALKKSLVLPQGATLRHGDPSIQFMVLPGRPGELEVHKFCN